MTLRSWHSTAGLLTENTSDDGVHFTNILVFLTCLVKFRKSLNKGPLATTSMDMIFQVRATLISWMSSWLEIYTEQVYSSEHQVEKSMPSRRNSLGNGRRSYVQIAPPAAWDIMQEAKRAKTSVREALAIRQQDAHAGCSGCQAGRWVNKRQSM